MENHTAKHFVLQLGSLISLYLSLSFLLVLLFGLINLIYPDAADSIWQIESASSSVRLGIAMTVVFFPTYLVLTRSVNKDRRRNPAGSYLGLTKWLIYLSLLIGGAVLLGDLVAVIMGFLEGDLTQRFLLKALAVVMVVGSAFGYYVYDVRGGWLENEKKSIIFGSVASMLVLVVALFGFAYIDSPSTVREQKIDLTQVQDLQNIQWRIGDYFQLNEVLPTTLAVLAESTGVPVPTSPEDRPPYQYNITETGFELCAVFTQSSKLDEGLKLAPQISPRDLSIRPVYETKDGQMVVVQPAITIIKPTIWEHGEGEVCFKSVVK